jgi:hypothetical protein
MRFLRWRRGLRLLALVLIVVAVPLPVLAERNKQPPPRPGVQASIVPAVRAVSAANATAPKPAAQAKTADKGELGSTSFFKKPAGIAALAIVAGGVGYAIYSARHDRIQPWGR